MNLTQNGSDYAMYPLQARSREEVIAETLVACALFMLGVTGNGIVCYVICKKRFASSSMYFFMLNLACADLLVCFASIPLTLLATRPQPVVQVKFGTAGCKVIRFVQYMLPPASVAILTATAIDRYFHICIPLRRIITTRATKQLATVCWGFAIFLTMPIFFLIESHKVVYEGSVYEFCNIKETSMYPKAGSIYLVFRGVLGFAIPLGVISVLYIKIVHTVWQRDRRHGSTNRQRANVVKSLLTVVVAFSLSWAPFSVLNKYYLFVETNKGIITREEIISFWIGLSASVYNPVIYAFYNNKFRDAFVSVIFKKRVTEALRSAAARDRPRSKTLPAIFTIEAPKEQGDLLADAGNPSNLGIHSKTRHLSLGFQPIYEDTKTQDNDIGSRNATTIFTVHDHKNVYDEDDLFNLEGSKKQTVFKKDVWNSSQLPTYSGKTNGSLINHGYACANLSNDMLEQPTLISDTSEDKAKRKAGLANLIPEIQTIVQCQHPPVLQRSQTFQFPDRNYVTDLRLLDVRSNDVSRNISFSRYGLGDNITRFSRSHSFNGPRSGNLRFDHRNPRDVGANDTLGSISPVALSSTIGRERVQENGGQCERCEGNEARFCM